MNGNGHRGHVSLNAAVVENSRRFVRPSTGGDGLAAYEPGPFWDEMFQPDGRPRPNYAALAEKLTTLGPLEVARRQQAADLSFQARGITFAVNQDPTGIEKILPFDLIPRLIGGAEWRLIEQGLEQRVRALNLFLHD